MRTRGAAATEIAEPLNQLPSCGMNQVCQPTGMRVDRMLLFEGPREVEVIEECHCEIKLTQCIRVPALKTYYSETPYETVIDVGGCSRSKGSTGVCMCVCSCFIFKIRNGVEVTTWAWVSQSNYLLGGETACSAIFGLDQHWCKKNLYILI